jgi:hypothetical protein
MIWSSITYTTCLNLHALIPSESPPPCPSLSPLLFFSPARVAYPRAPATAHGAPAPPSVSPTPHPKIPRGDRALQLRELELLYLPPRPALNLVVGPDRGCCYGGEVIPLGGSVEVMRTLPHQRTSSGGFFHW